MTLAAQLRRTRLAAALAALGVTAACHFIAGDFEVDPGSTSGTGGTNGPDEPNRVVGCDAGEFRCQGAELQVCDPAQDPPWRTTRTCPSTVTCDARAGLCHVCNPGEHRCAGWQLETCNADGSDFDVAAQCTSSVYCNVGEGRCLECLAGEAQCDGASLSVCNGTRDGWVVTQCESADLCNERSQTCRCCAPDELQCTGSTLRRCVADCAWAPVTDCATPELCTATVQRYPSIPEDWTGQCEPPVCDPGTYRCSAEDGRQLLGCPPSRTGWEVYDTCDTAGLCDAEAGICQPGCGPGISPGSYRCEGIELQQCSLDGTHFVTVKTCATADQCNATRQDCVACAPGEHQCSGSTLRRCAEDSTWETVEECASATLCLATEGRCESPGCEAGTFSCAGNVLRQCGSDNSSWETVEYCLTDALCDAQGGHCDPPGCPEAGAVDCAGNVLRTCPSSLVAWEVLQTCPEGWLCDAQNQQCTGECPTPPFQCHAGVPMECRTDADSSLSWQPTGPPCTTSALCFASEWGSWCLQPVCEVGEYQCTDATPQVLQTCSVGRDRWNDVAACSGTLCDPVGAQCNVCVANEFSCGGADLRQCGPAGQVLEARGTCRDAEHCHAEGPVGYCFVCDPGETQCSGANQVQACTADRGGFGASTACEYGCQDNAGNADYCAGCPVANEIQCVEEQRPGSTRVCPADRRAWGASQPCAAGLGCVNDGSADYCADTCVPNQPSCVGDAGVHTCSATGEGFDPTRYECANAGNLKRCVGGVLSSTDVVPCPAATPFCLEGACVECTGTTRECIPDTASRRECVNGTWHLENCAARGDGNVACYQGDCSPCNDASPPTCLDNDTRRHCVDGAWTSTDCAGATPVCSSLLRSCAECNANSAATCTNDTTRRSCATGTGTWTTTPCDVHCLVVSGQGTCVACDPDTTPATCTAGDDGILTCSPTGSITTTPCLDPAPVCASVDDMVQCVGCASGTCTGDTPYCLDGIECVQCQPDSTTCRQAPVAAGLCNAEGSWEYDECTGATPRCNAGSCVECIDNGDCPGEMGCLDGSCACPTLTPDPCGDHCVDTQTNPSHCGTCDHACVAPTGICSGGACVGCGSDDDCSVTGQTCQSGQCRCPGGQQVCGTACVDPSSDETNCGTCGTVCAATQQCEGGHCVCIDPLLTNCEGACVDTSSDPDHCGGCDQGCPAPTQTCEAGVCECPLAAPTLCGATCVDLTSNDTHCGDCTTDCTSTSSPHCLDRFCVECRDNADCASSPATSHCDDNHVCVE